MPMIKVKHGGAVHEIELTSTECPYKRIGAVLGLPPSRLTVIRAGKKLPPPNDPALAAAIVPGALYLVSGTASKDELPSTARRWAGDAAIAAQDLYSRLSWDFFVALMLWLWTLLMAFASGSVRFITSMVVAPDPERVGRPREGRPAEPAHL
jgi:hypothetical protein